MIQGGATASYQCPRASSNKTSFVDIHQVRIKQINSFPNRKQNINSLSIENGGTPNQTMIALSKEIWEFLLKKKIAILARYLPITLNKEVSGSHETAGTPRIGNCVL